jgi:hypothetical protein
MLLAYRRQTGNNEDLATLRICFSRTVPRLTHAILAVMNWFDRKASKYTFNRAIAGVIGFTLYGSAGLMQLVKYFVGHDSFYLYAGLLNTALGSLMVYFFVRILRAVKAQ